MGTAFQIRWGPFYRRLAEDQWKKVSEPSVTQRLLPIENQNMAASQVPPTLKAIQPYLKIAQEYDKRDAVIAYYCK